MKGEEALKRFHKLANEIHNDIKIELRWNRQKIEFLDMWVSIREGRIETGLYVNKSYLWKQRTHKITKIGDSV